MYRIVFYLHVLHNIAFLLELPNVAQVCSDFLIRLHFALNSEILTN